VHDAAVAELEEVLHHQAGTLDVVAGDGVVAIEWSWRPSMTMGTRVASRSSQSGATSGEIATMPSTWRSARAPIARTPSSPSMSAGAMMSW
jgi:hypothetical protein